MFFLEPTQPFLALGIRWDASITHLRFLEYPREIRLYIPESTRQIYPSIFADGVAQ